MKKFMIIACIVSFLIGIFGMFLNAKYAVPKWVTIPIIVLTVFTIWLVIMPRVERKYRKPRHD